MFVFCYSAHPGPGPFIWPMARGRHDFFFILVVPVFVPVCAGPFGPCGPFIWALALAHFGRPIVPIEGQVLRRARNNRPGLEIWVVVVVAGVFVCCFAVSVREEGFLLLGEFVPLNMGAR